MGIDWGYYMTARTRAQIMAPFAILVLVSITGGLHFSFYIRFATDPRKSCMPNIRQSFKVSSFSVQFNATKDIKAGEQLCYAYCPLGKSASERQAELEPYGFVCNCSACVNATPETDHLRKTFMSNINQLVGVLHSGFSGGVLESALNLEQGGIGW